MIFVPIGYIAVAAAVFLILRAIRTPVFREPESRAVYLILSFTWGALATFPGAVCALAARLSGRTVVRYRHGWAVGLRTARWGVDLGAFFFAPEGSPVRSHEYGHSLQNIVLGPFFPAVVLLPSAARFWFRAARSKAGKEPSSGYDSAWFERSATVSGK